MYQYKFKYNNDFYVMFQQGKSNITNQCATINLLVCKEGKKPREVVVNVVNHQYRIDVVRDIGYGDKCFVELSKVIDDQHELVILQTNIEAMVTQIINRYVKQHFMFSEDDVKTLDQHSIDQLREFTKERLQKALWWYKDHLGRQSKNYLIDHSTSISRVLSIFENLMYGVTEADFSAKELIAVNYLIDKRIPMMTYFQDIIDACDDANRLLSNKFYEAVKTKLNNL